MTNYEKKLSQYIDQLNRERTPREHGKTPESAEMKRLMETVRMVRLQKEPQMPNDDFPMQITAAVKGGAVVQTKNKLVKNRKMIFTGAIAAAAVVILLVSLNPSMPFTHTNIVSAMEQAMNNLRAYHGILEITQINGQGEEMLQAKREIWADQDGRYYIKEMTGDSKDQITVNNGKAKWQLRPLEQEAYIFAAFPDTYQFTFELGNEIEDVKNALSVEKVGEDVIAGRKASILKVTPDGGDAYQLWVDNETDLPLQKQTAMQNAIQYRYTYTTINYTDTIPKELLQYQLPKDYEEVNTNPEQFVSGSEEAESLTGFLPVKLQPVPEKFEFTEMSVLTEEFAVKYYYRSVDRKKTVVLIQRMASAELAPESNAILGSVNNQTAEIRASIEGASMDGDNGVMGGAFEGLTGIGSIRWQETGYEYAVIGNASIEDLSLFAEAVSGGEVQIPNPEENTQISPQVEVPVDIAAEANEQKSVDAGHSPWKLDPAFVTQVFASLLLSPDGITGDYPISYDEITIVSNDGTQAVAEIKNDKSIAKKVYLKRLIRQDDSGIWSVTGYDKDNAGR